MGLLYANALSEVEVHTWSTSRFTVRDMLVFRLLRYILPFAIPI
jgi:hypothetical protein